MNALFTTHLVGLNLVLRHTSDVSSSQPLVYLVSFLRYSQIQVENCEFFIPQLHSMSQT